MKLSEYISPLLLDQNLVKSFSEMNGKWYEETIHSESKLYTLILVPSELCNLHCKYCYETTKNSTHMDISLARKLIKEYFEILPIDNILKIELRGGEPLLEFDFIKKICEWTFENYKSNNYYFYAVTNGTCFSSSDCRSWFFKYRDKIKLPLSIDGTKKTHNSNRDNSFELIDIDFFLKTWKNAYTYTTVLPENSADIFENLLFLTQKGFTVRANFEFAQTWTDDNIITCVQQLHKLADEILKKRIKQRLNLFSCYGFIDFTENSDEDRQHMLNCNAGHRRFIYTPDGKKYPCHTLVPSAFNHYGVNNEVIFEKLYNDVLNPPDCCQCYYYYLCYICVGFSMSYANDYKWRNKSFCEITRIRTFLSAYYWGKKIENNIATKKLSDEEKYIAKKIYTLYKAENLIE
ncbi:MAG: 4Fe-4S cluster-binding domain-containing protein [Spirochaetaceae bacterium]|jgi:radical SAM protein with 4Fe4S-binding SPASM domain|nr:4Fe-4S cluster-binding domain-containing protein [Spirochaetaceae bacterium]